MTEHSELPAAGTGPGSGFWLLALLVIAGACYLAGVQRPATRGERWPRSRSIAATGGLLCLVVAVLPAPGPAMTFPSHIARHLLLAVLGPRLLALSAPITLARRTLPRFGRRSLVNVAQRDRGGAHPGSGGAHPGRGRDSRTLYQR